MQLYFPFRVLVLFVEMDIIMSRETLCFVIFELLLVKTSCSPIVGLETNGTLILGRKLYTVFDNRPFIAFYDVPYAEPPVGQLRFQPPKPCEWLNKQIYNYSKPPADTCGLEYDEDVLYLTVYMPDDEWREGNYAVVVWLHEQSSYHGPDFLIDEDVIVVAISFRTNIFGFLNTGDYFARGNMAAKDILLGLKWLRDNIIYFNGDPNRVTVIGSGIAADIVASFPLSPLAEDLMARVVIQSGSALDPAIYNSNNFEILNKLYLNLWGWSDNFDRTRLYDLLRNATGKKLATVSDDLFDSTEVRDRQRLINDFGPSIEVFSKGAFISEKPIKLYEEGKVNNVDVMIGYTSLEALYKLEGFVHNRKLLKYLNHNFQYLLPFEGNTDEYGSKQYKKIKRKIMDFYFVNGTIGEHSLIRYGKYLSDQVIYPLLRQARLHARNSRNHVYLYRFSYKGSLNIIWNSVLDDLEQSGATAGDEICYQFRCKSSYYKESDERQFIKKIARLLANFAKYGNPTPKAKNGILGDLHWESLDYWSLRGIHLGKTFKMVTVPEVKRFEFWDELRRKYYFGREDVFRDEL